MAKEKEDNTQRKRMELRLLKDTADDVKYEAGKDNISMNEFIEDAVRHYIAWRHQDYDVPTAMVQRVNQLIEMQQATNHQLASLQNVVHATMKPILMATRGENYLSSEGDD